MICGSGGSKSRLAKAAGAEPAGQMKDEKLHAIVARSTFASEKAKNNSRLEHFLELRCRISAHRCGAKHISKSKCTKHTMFGTLFEIEMSKKCTLLWREAHAEVKMCKTHHPRTSFRSWDVEKVHAVVARSTFRSQKCKKKNWGVRSTFLTFRCRFAWQARGIAILSKVSKTWRFCSISKNDGRRGIFEEDPCIFRGRRSTRDKFIRAVRRSGRWFPERGCILEHQIFRFAEMILRDRCSTSYDPVSLFRGRRSTLDRWSGKIAKRIGTKLSALCISTFHFWRKSGRIASFLMLSTSKDEEVSQTFFAFDVVKFKNWGSLAELLRFWCCQVQKLRKSRRIALFSSLQIDR